MGLSSSQGRLLMLTSRLSDVQMQMTLNAQRQSQLALDSEKAASEYNDKMSNYKLQIKMPDDSESIGYKKQDLDYSKMLQLGYLITDANKQVYLTKNKEGEWEVPKDEDGNPKVKFDDTKTKAYIGEETYSIVDGTEYLTDPKTLQNAIIEGVLYIYNTDSLVSGISLDTLKSETEMEYVLDTSDDAMAQSKYDTELARISRQQNQLDTELKQLETQHEVVMKEIDSVKDVIGSNVDRTFKLFSNG